MIFIYIVLLLYKECALLRIAVPYFRIVVPYFRDNNLSGLSFNSLSSSLYEGHTNKNKTSLSTKSSVVLVDNDGEYKGAHWYRSSAVVLNNHKYVDNFVFNLNLISI